MLASKPQDVEGASRTTFRQPLLDLSVCWPWSHEYDKDQPQPSSAIAGLRCKLAFEPQIPKGAKSKSSSAGAELGHADKTGPADNCRQPELDSDRCQERGQEQQILVSRCWTRICGYKRTGRQPSSAGARLGHVLGERPIDWNSQKCQQRTLVSHCWTRARACKEALEPRIHQDRQTSSSAGAGLECLLVGEPRCQEQPTASSPRQPLLDSGVCW
jgi:hypothetical protein